MTFLCPVCRHELQRVAYEGFPIFYCGTCQGYLAGRRRVESIKRSRTKSTAQLKSETIQQTGRDTAESLGCPRCAKPMTKEFHDSPAALYIDLCKPCQLVWFDGGELARLQLSYEISPQGREAADLKRRIEHMTPEDRQQFEYNVAQLPRGDVSLLSAFADGVLFGFTRLLRLRA